MTYVLIGLIGVGCFLAGMGFEAFMEGRTVDGLEQKLFRKEIECERLKEGRP